MENNLSAQSLETIFLSYSPFWEGWIKQQCNSLLLRDIRLLNARFKYNTTAKYTQVIPKSTIKRLESDLSFYKKWAVAAFKTEIKNLFSNGSLSLAYSEPIESLPLDKELIGILKGFGKNTVPQIVNELSDTLLIDKLFFENILKFKERLNEIENSNTMKTTALELKKSFACYAPFWDEWVHYSFNTLTIEEVDLVNKMVVMGFNIQTHLINESEMELIVGKLKKSNSAYISWAIMKFEFMLIKMFHVDTLEDSFEMPIKQLSMDKQLKDILLRFESPTLNLLFEHRNKVKLGGGKFFVNILLFRERYNELSKISESSNTWSRRLAKVIKVLRLDKKINQIEMAQILDMDKGAYAHKEKTELHLNVDQLVLVAEKLGLSIYQLIAIVHADIVIGVAAHSKNELEEYFTLWNKEHHAAINLSSNVLNELRKIFCGGKGTHSPGKPLLTTTGRVLAA